MFEIIGAYLALKYAPVILEVAVRSVAACARAAAEQSAQQSSSDRTSDFESEYFPRSRNAESAPRMDEATALTRGLPQGANQFGELE